ncbi:hypothetical protein TSUD_162630 [Trifolium subterraneum]|uniref:Uncharacterized protein n=1 Tax=Trifolium subterraneum TaxID=3900 RepID=A0A2Z6MWJ4_TRISU|nr:hypothetical protein TSUD_162630 [Trifolium subterraneum]
MASASNTNNDDVNNNVDVAPPFTLNAGGPVLMPVDGSDQPIPETDHRDGRETSPESDDEDAVQFLSERKKGKQSQIAPGKSATNPQPNSPRVTENAALLDALRETIRTVNEQSNRIRALEDGQRQILGYIKPPSPPRRAERSESPPARRAGTSQRRPVLERVQPQVQKRNKTPPREDSVARTNKRGKAAALFEQRPRSPPRRKEILLGGMTQGSRGDDYQNRRENSPRREETPTHSPGWSDDEVYKGPLSRQIMDLELPRALQKPPQLGKLVDNSSGFKLLSFLDAYSGYNQIPMAVADRTKTAFMTESGNYYYNVMPFGLKNAGATYQRMMNKVFRGEIGDMLEVYMDDMIVKSHEEVDHTVHLQRVFEQARKVNMRFNPKKCTFGIRAGKFLGFYLTERGIEANPDKCRAFTEFPTPNDKKSIQTLNEMLTALSRFVAKSAQHALPLFKLLRKESAFEWTEECEQALQHLKKALSEPPVLSRPDVGEVLYLYLAVASEAVSATLIRETIEGQKPVYFTSRALQGPELRYQRIEKVALALVTAARRLRYYFLAHTIVVRTDQPIKSLLVRPDMAGRMLKWSLELSEFDIRYESRKALKAQGILIEVSLALSFPTSNNQAEYEAFLAGLRLAEDVGAKEIVIYTDSQLVASQVLGEYQAKNDNLSEYLALVKERITKFDSAEIQHVPREHNKRADILSKLASTKRRNGNKSVIQEILSHPSIQKPTRILDINAVGDANCWMTPVYNYLAHGTLPNDEKEAATCADEATADYILREIHEGINSQHLGGRSLARKALRAGYYWPTMQQDAKEHVKKCDKCQRHGDMHLAPPHELKSLSSPWPFAWWGMDILGPFTRGNLQCKYLIVGVDYFTKWVEAEPLTEITSFRILRFFKRDILCRFGIPQAVVTDNGTQFTDKTFRGFLAKINTKHHFTSVEHPQTNGQAEAANRVILRGLRRRLGDAKKQWVEELPHVLWAYRTTPHSTTGETPFRLAYGTETVIPVEIGEPSRRTEAPLDEEMNDEAMREELDLVEEIRTAASLKETSLKQLVAARHDTKVIKRDFEVGSLVLRRNAKDSHEGKLAANWEGPYRVRGKTDNGAYHLETLQGKEISRTWNAQKLKQYYS